MGSYFGDTYLDNLRPVLLDYMTKAARGQNIADLPLSLANRAQRNLWAKKPWCDLAVDVDVSLTNNSYTLPAGFGRIVELGADLTGTGQMNYWYYEGNEPTGYKMRDSFTNAAGHSWSITFFYTQSQIKLIYQKLIDDLTGEGTEYLFFPSNLMILECQRIYLLERGNLNELVAVESKFDEIFKDYCNCHQWINYNPKHILRDNLGSKIFVEQYDLTGESSGYGRRSIMENSFLGI